MKTTLLNISIILVYTLSFSCSDTTSPDVTPPLGDFLYGTYVDVFAHWSQNPDGNPMHPVSPTDSTKLTLNSNGDYTMRLEVYVEILDTIFNIYQEGNYVTKETQYVDSDEPLTFPTWRGNIVFTPEGNTLWEAEFLIPESTFDLFFDERVKVELPNSMGWIIVRNWYRKRSFDITIR